MRRLIARLFLQLGIVDGGTMQPAGCAGLEPVEPEAKFTQRSTHPSRGSLACPPAGRLRLSGVHDGLQEGAGCQHHSRCPVFHPATGQHTSDAKPRPVPTGVSHRLEPQSLNRFLPQDKVRRRFDEMLDLQLVEPLVRLRPGSVHRRPLGPIENPVLNPGGVDRLPHQPAQRIDLTHELPLAHAANRRVAAHLADSVAVGRQQTGSRSEPSRGSRCLNTSMTAADHQHIKIIKNVHEKPDHRRP